MSENERGEASMYGRDDELTLEALARRLEALERGEAGASQREEPSAEFHGPESMGDQEDTGLALQILAQRLERLEHESASPRQLDTRETLGEITCVSVAAVTNGKIALRGQALQAEGVGVRGVGDTGVWGSSARVGRSGVYGQNISSGGYGVVGDGTGTGAGILGRNGGGDGIRGEGTGGAGVRGRSTSTFSLAPPGVAGVSDDGSGVDGRSTTWFGVLGRSTRGTGVIGLCGSDEGVAVIGRGNPGKAGVFTGPVDVHGNPTVLNGNKPFKIDHPLDPQNKYLLHNAVESPERKNVYDGVTQLDEDGAAWVDLPEWFEALNTDFRYQLTAVGGAAPDLHVAEEIHENRFKVAGGEGGMKVCWQLTGSRKDPWAAANPFEVEQEKPQKERGRYLEPDLYNAPVEQKIMIVPEEEKLRQSMRQEPPEASSVLAQA